MFCWHLYLILIKILSPIVWLNCKCSQLLSSISFFNQSNLKYLKVVNLCFWLHLMKTYLNTLDLRHALKFWTFTMSANKTFNGLEVLKMHTELSEIGTFPNCTLWYSHVALHQTESILHSSWFCKMFCDVLGAHLANYLVVRRISKVV